MRGKIRHILRRGRESVLNELVRELMRKGIVDENMGREMLQRLA
jgi:hypothetical protein